jgi:hypothetical protein
MLPRLLHPNLAWKLWGTMKPSISSLSTLHTNNENFASSAFKEDCTLKQKKLLSVELAHITRTEFLNAT